MLHVSVLLHQERYLIWHDGSKILISTVSIGIIKMKSIYLSKKEVARKLNISPSTVARWSKAEIIPLPIRLGPNKIVWIEHELEKALDEKKKERGFLGHKPIKLIQNVNPTQ